MLVSKLSLVIGSTILDIVDSDKLTHAILLYLDQLVDLIKCDHEMIRVYMWMLVTVAKYIGDLP